MKKGVGAGNTRHSWRKEVWAPCLSPHLFVSVKVPHWLWAPNTYQLQYTNTHVEQNLKANAMSFLTSKIRDDEGQNLFNVEYIAVNWQIFCCFFVTRKFYQKIIQHVRGYMTIKRAAAGCLSNINSKFLWLSENDHVYIRAYIK